ncbi:MAG: hypothetical protein R2725_04665 [Solirubrobacterales bacterium]
MSRSNATEVAALSDRTLEAERGRLIASVDQLRRRADVHRRVLEGIEEQLAREEGLLREIEELSDRRPQLRLERLDKQLHGRRLREIAVEILRQERGPGQPIHYREWFSLVRSHGFEVGGKDPLQTFLTGIGRAEGIERLGGRSGLYLLET